MRFGVVVFPGSNCDHDAWYAVSHNLGQQAEFIWHDSPSIGHVDAVILPGGFAYGDYLRCGAIAKFSPVMAAVRKFAADGGLVLGICNGFQILVESGLLPGALAAKSRFEICLPGRDPAGRDHGYAVHGIRDARASCCEFRWRMAKAAISPTNTRSTCSEARRSRGCCGISIIPNGSLRDIAGICNERRNVMGMMPHPERAADVLMGSTDGRVILESMVHSLVAAARMSDLTPRRAG